MRAYQNMVYSTAVRLLGETEARDIAQEVFLKAYDRFAELADNPHAGGWLKTVARNLCLNHLTRYRARWTFFSEMAPEGESGESGWGTELGEGRESAAPVEASERREALERAIQRLPEAQRVSLVLYHFEEMSYEEIAARLGISLAKVKTDIHRARETLRRRLAPSRAELLGG